MKAVICPVCQGEGERYYPLQDDSNADAGYYLFCHGCGGRGWVEVHEEIIAEKDLSFTLMPWPRT